MNVRRLRQAPLRLAASMFVIGCLTTAASLVAQTPAIQKMEFDEAIKRAIERNPTVAEAATSIGRAESFLQQARSATTLSVSGSFSNVLLDHSRGFNGGVTQPQDQVAVGGGRDLSRAGVFPAGRP